MYEDQSTKIFTEALSVQQSVGEANDVHSQNGKLCSHLDDPVKHYVITWRGVQNTLSGKKRFQDIMFSVIIMLSNSQNQTKP